MKLKIERAALAIAIVVGLTAAPAAQFDVASIKPANPSAPIPGRMGSHANISPGGVRCRNESLKELVEDAWSIENYQITGGPGWSSSARFDIDAKPAGATTHEQLMQMLQALLAERFKLAVHRETKELPVYALVVARGGPKFSRSTATTMATPSMNRLGRNVSMGWFARYLTRFGSDRPVIDKTGLAGNYDLNLDMEKIGTAAAAAAAGGPAGIGNMFQATVDAMQDLGLKVTPAKAPVELLVIDRAERPSAN
jgi:uncharacterized protein (TIGR03435 family)